MSAFTPAGGGGAATGSNTPGLTPVSTPTLFNDTLAGANTEQSYVIPPGTKRVSIKARGQYSLKLSYIAGQSGTTYVMIPPGAEYTEVDLAVTSLTAYYQSPTASVVVEILTWI